MDDVELLLLPTSLVIRAHCPYYVFAVFSVFVVLY